MQTHIHYKTAGNSPCLQALTIYACSNEPPSHCVAQIWYALGINRTYKLARVKPRFYFKNPVKHWDKAGTETHAAIYRRAVPNNYTRD